MLGSNPGRAPDELIEEAMAGYLKELTETREMLDARYDDLKEWTREGDRRRNCIQRT